MEALKKKLNKVQKEVEEKNEELKKRPRLKKPNKQCVIHALFKYRPNISVHYGVKFYNF